MAAHQIFDFTYHSSVASFAVTSQAYLANRPEASFESIGTGALLLDTRDASDPKILLLQRAAGDSYPGRWEPPGGACDDDDESILHGAARELWEEAGLTAGRFDGLVGEPHFFTSRSGRKICRFSFAVHVKLNGETSAVAKLDPKEHQNSVWATEREVRARKASGFELEFTTEQVEHTVLLAFDLARWRQ